MARVTDQVAGHDAAAAGEHAHDARAGLRVVAGVLERFPGHLQEEPLLGLE
jgi:hypothetical protein